MERIKRVKDILYLVGYQTLEVVVKFKYLVRVLSKLNI